MGNGISKEGLNDLLKQWIIFMNKKSIYINFLTW